MAHLEGDRDLLILAYPSEHKASVEVGSADGMIFMKRKYESIEKRDIPENDINSFLSELRELKLSFSFKAA